MKRIRKLISSITLAALLVGSGLPGLPGASAAFDPSLAGNAASAKAAGLQVELQEGLDYVPGKVAVKLKNENNQAALERRGIRGYSVQSNTAEAVYTLDIADGKDVLQAVQELNERPDIEYAEPVYIYRASDVPTGPIGEGGGGGGFPLREEYSVIEATYAWNHTERAELAAITVAVLDSGIDLSHPDLRDSIVEGTNFVMPSPSPQDDNGHGTHVAGIIGAQLSPGNGTKGVAHGVKLMPIKVLDKEGKGTTDIIARAIDYAVEHGAHVINMSLGGASYSRLVHEALDRALEQGVVIVAAAGNDSDHWVNQDPANLNPKRDDQVKFVEPVSYPAALPGVIAVGAAHRLNDQWYVADFSNAGREITVSAPGVNIRSTDLGGTYSIQSGTSQATPFVSGLAALLKAEEPTLKPSDIRTLIQEGAVDAGEAWTDNLFGSGVIRVDYSYRAIGSPRLTAATTTEALPAGKLRLDIAALHPNGTVNEAVYGDIRLYGQQYQYETQKWSVLTGYENRLVTLENGQASMTLDVPDAYDYRFYIDDLEGSSTPLVRSDSMYAYLQTKAPVFSLSSGTYTGSQSLSITSGTPGARIEYVVATLQSNGTYTYGQPVVYSEPITISANSTVLAAAFKNGVISEVSVAEYTIATRTVPIGGGGGPIFMAQPSDKKDMEKDPLGRTTVQVEVSKDRALKQLQDEEMLVIDAQSNESIGSVQVEMPMEVIKAASESRKPIRIEAGEVVFELPQQFIPVDSSISSDALFRIGASKAEPAQTPSAADHLTMLGDAWELHMTVDGRSVTQFQTGLPIEFTLPLEYRGDSKQVGVYYYNNRTESWEHVGGVLNGRSVRFSTDHFSLFAIMRNDLSTWSAFSDVSEHWAAKDIEAMAKRGIVNGIGDGQFAPDQEVSRAEFASMLSRALSLSEKADGTEFSDVASDSWYYSPVYQAYHAGIVQGTEPNAFSPMSIMTREQMAVMLMRAYDYARDSKAQADTIPSGTAGFTDENDFAVWAKSSIQAAVSLDLLSGNPDGSFQPKASATRAHAVVVLKRLMDDAAK
jgi:subtilisin family serine protease